MRASAGPISFLYILWMSRPEPGTVRAVLPRRLNVLHSAVIRSVAGLVLSEGLTVGQDRHWTEAQIPPPPSNTSLRACTWVTLDPGGTLRVSQTLPPIVEPRPMVMRPRMVAPA